MSRQLQDPDEFIQQQRQTSQDPDQFVRQSKSGLPPAPKRTKTPPPEPIDLKLHWGAIAKDTAKDIARSTWNFLTQQAPEMVGAGLGALVGTGAEAGVPGPGTIAGAASGATAVRSVRNLITTAMGPKPGERQDPRTPAQVAKDQAKDVGGQAVMGALQEAGPVIGEAIMPSAGRALVDSKGAYSFYAPAGAAKASTRILPPLLKPHSSEEERAAIKLADKEGIRVPLGIRGRGMVAKVAQGTKAALEYVPGSGGRIDKETVAGEEAFRQTKGKIALGISPTIADRFQFGADLKWLVGQKSQETTAAEEWALNQKVADLRQAAGPRKGTINLANSIRQAKERTAQALKDQAKALYGKFDEIVNNPENMKRIKVGDEPMRGIDGKVLVTSTGQPLTVPIHKDVASPISIIPVKDAIKSILSRFEGSTATAMQQANPGLVALHRISQLPDEIGAAHANQELSALMELGRDAFPAMKDVSQGLASKVVPVFHEAIDRGVAELGDDAINALNAGRAVTKQRYDIFGTSAARGAANRAEAGRTVSMIRSLDMVGIDSLLKQTGTAELPTIRREVVESLLRKSKTETGSVSQRALTKGWNSISDEMKQKIFTPEQIQKFDNVASLTKLYGPNHPATELSEVLNKDSGAVFDYLIQNADKSAGTINILRGAVGREKMQDLGRAVFEGIFDKASQGGGYKGITAFNEWNRLGPMTKTALIGDAERVKEIDAFFKLGSMMKLDANPSGSAKVLSLIKFAGRTGEMLALNPIIGTTKTAATVIGSNMVARGLYNPGFAKVLTQGLRTPVTASTASTIASRITFRLLQQEAKEHGKPDQLPPAPTRTQGATR